MKITAKLLGVVSVVGLVGMAVTTTALAADPMEDAITARKAFMQVSKFNMAILGAMIKGEREYDPELAMSAAKNLHAGAMMENGAMWPAESGKDNPALAKKTRALPEIWTTYPAVSDKHKAWTEAAAAVVEVAGDGVDALKPKFGALGKSCKGCHEDFRAAKKQ